MTLAVLTGVSHRVWLSDPAAMSTAAAVLERMNEQRRR